LEFLSEFDFDIKHNKGKGEKVVDALGRRVHEMHALAINIYISDLKSRVLEVVASYQHYLQVK
jgi:hypothetical protein